MQIERGTVFGHRYVVQSQVGTGGMATVYRGTDQTLDRLVAIKVMLERYAQDPSFAARFKQEAQAAARDLLERDPELTTCPATAQRVAELFAQNADTLN